MRPQTRYADSDGYSIAWQAFGSGPDVVLIPGFVSNVEVIWEMPSAARFLDRLASFCRLIVFDKRGTGLSDRVPVKQLPSLGERIDDVRAVMVAAGSERAVLFGISEGGPMAALFAASYPRPGRRVGAAIRGPWRAHPQGRARRVAPLRRRQRITARVGPL
jgi:pimeloyl-ACP methyl ester carboxylesterase